MTTQNENVILWPDSMPGVLATGQEQHERAREVPYLKLFLLPGEQFRPLMIVLPGGGYGGRAAHEADPIALWLNELGYHALVCHYRVAPWRHPTPLLDAQRAVRLARHHAASWKIDSKRIGILGFSAGGHLASSVANFGDDGTASASDPVSSQSSRVQALVACYPVITFGDAFTHKGSRTNLLGENPAPELQRRLSLETSVTPQNPPTFIWHGANDAAVPVENSLLYAQALSAAQIPLSLHVYPNAPHGKGLALEFESTAREWTDACASWLREIF